MNSMKKRLMSLLLAVCMAVSALPTTALALRGDGGHPAHERCSIEDAVEQPALPEEPETPAEEVPPEGEAPAQDEPAVDEPTADEPAVDDPVVDDPTVDDPTTDEPVADDSLPEAEEPAPEEVDAADEPVPLADEPQSEEKWIASLDSSVTAVIVTTFDGLAAAVKNTNISDIVLSAGEPDDWTWTEELVIDREVHITVAEAETVTLMRTNGANGMALFNVGKSGHLILGDGSISTMVEIDLQNGDYEVIPAKTGELIIDGGAVWKRGTEYVPGKTSFTSETIVFYGSDGVTHYQYTNDGVKAKASLITSSGTLDIWDGVTLQNNDKYVAYGSAICSENGSTLQMYGGVVTMCATINNSDEGMGAVYVGPTSNIWWVEDYNFLADAATFNMYGGRIDNNTAYGNGGGS